MGLSCAICSDFFGENDDPVSSIPCGHVYHSRCLTLWMSESKTCPQCRARFQSRSIRRLYFNSSSELNASSSEFEIEIQNLKTMLNAREEELDVYKGQTEVFAMLLTEAEEKIFNLQSTMKTMEAQLTAKGVELAACKKENETLKKIVKDRILNLTLSPRSPMYFTPPSVVRKPNWVTMREKFCR